MEEKEIALAALGVIVTLSQKPPPDTTAPPSNAETPVNPNPIANRVIPDSTVKRGAPAICPTKEPTETPLPPEPPTCLAGV